MGNMMTTSKDYAGFEARLGSVFIDWLILSLVSTLVSFLLMQLTHGRMSTDAFLQFCMFLLLPFYILLQFFYFAWFNANGRQTFGKKFFGIAVVDMSLKPISLSRSFGRVVAFFFDTVIIGLGHLLMVFRRDKQTLHDTLAKTYVVRVKPERQYESLLAIATLIAFIFVPMRAILRNYVQAFRIPTGAFKSTMLVGDFILVDKHWTKKNTPQRGDIIVFKFPQDPRLDYIKRCIAVGGQTIEMKEGIVYVDGQPEGKQESVERDYDPEEGHYVRYYKIMTPKGKTYTIRHYEDHVLKSSYENFGPLRAPEGHYFMMGDNRDNSADSRSYGFIPQENIVGKAGIIYWSWDRNVPLYRLTDKICWSRIGNIVH
jgi:signal peptidase I